MAREKETGLPRHARVVPAFVAAIIRRPLDTWIGSVRPAELLRWERKGDPPESVRRDLRQTIIRRTRVRAERLWTQRVNVRVADGWREHLSEQDRKRIEALPLSEDKPLENWTLREVKEALHVPLEHTLDLLARLEAIYWEPPPLSLRRAVEPPHVQGPPVEMTQALREQAQAVLALPWLDKVTRYDLRFAYDGDEPLFNWINRLIDSTRVPESFPGMLERLLQADRFTAETEARELAIWAARECAPRSGSEETAQRWVAILMRRHISRTGAGRTLAEVGAEFGVTRERIRQICEAFEDLFVQAQAVTPALDRVLQAAARVSPAGVNELDEQFRRFIGEDAGIESLVSWAALLGRENTPVQCERVRTKARGQVVEVTMVQVPDAAPWVEALIRHVSRDSSMFGCTNILRVAGRLALKEGVAPGQEAIESAIEAATGFRWLDKSAGWFTLGDSAGCSAASRVRKIVAVAHDSIGTDEIAGALASDDMWMLRESGSLGLATPPVHVLRELFLGWPWLSVVQRGRFVASPEFDPAGVLFAIEQTIVEVITAHDGVVCRFELKEAVVEQLGLTDMLLAAQLGSSPIVERVEHGLYRLRGRRVGNGALNAARQRLSNRAMLPGSLLLEAGPNEFFARVTEASLRNEQYHIPTRFHSRLAGKRHNTVSAEGGPLGESRVSQSGSLSGLNRLFPEVKVGNHYRIEVVEDGLRVALCVGPLSDLPGKESRRVDDVREALN
ncbi:sigma factor-like helix-turn-helix DNA-binding protein [Paraburkholderia adhaesiva]|uniref:sigma factor-like helix-turn-helix DNA-binding protein n=1 Tax=Paraburkholderia adhaesiva TaxID=2883244 RepID=UPI001F1CD863|nr:sigma factor-like helix-turn-helix DNA-binding protein [Paraburkholderia adhaesiva]